MTTDDAALPLSAAPGGAAVEDLFAIEAHRLARQWAELPPEHFKAAIAAAKAERALRSQEMVLQMRLKHDLEVQRIQADKEASERQARAEQERAEREAAAHREASERQARAEHERAEREATAHADRLRHRRHVLNVSTGAVISVALLVAGVLVADTAVWLSLILCGPSLLALAKVYVLQKSDPDDMKILGRSARTATNAAASSQPLQPPVP
ncbi:hypothetical protein ACWGKK_39705 [Streptomyces chartreusis]